jgi:lysophospholipase L1-like esterase
MRRSFFIVISTLAAFLATCNVSTSSRTGSGASRDGGTSALGDEEPGEPDPSGQPRIDFIGRFDTRDPAGPICGWPGCRIVARFEGTSLSVRLKEVTEDWMAGGPSEWDLTIDGELHPKIVMAEGSKEYVLATGLSRGIHVVELYKRSEAQNGATRFLGYDLGDGKLLAPPGRLVRKIEIIGDSSATGFGVEGVGHGPKCPGLNYAAKWQNFHESFGARLGVALSAEVYGTAYSGKGIVKNIWRPDKDTMPVIFPRALPTDPQSTWDFSTYVPNVVVIMIGGNDFAIGQPTDDGPANLAEFADGYHAFVATIRQKYPDGHLFLVTSPSVTDTQPPERRARSNVSAGIAEVVARRTKAGDTRVFAVAPPIAAPSELTGCEGHGSPELHQRIADDLAPIIREETGW